MALAVPLNGFRELLSRQYPYLRSPLLELIGARGVWLLLVVLATAGAVAVLLHHRRLMNAAVAVLLVLSPFCAVTFGQALWRAAHYDDTAFRNLPLTPLIRGANRSPKVVWFICDEWDYRLTLPERDHTLALPEIDRLAGESLAASNAYPPGSGTAESIPSFFSGQLFSPVWEDNVRQLHVFRKGQQEELDWSAQTSIFERVRAQGFNTALLEWFHPTCRLLGNLTYCDWWPMARQYNSMGDTFTEILPNQARSLFETNLFSLFGRSLTAEHHAAIYHQMMAHAGDLIVKPEFGFTVVHLPVPHNPFVYDRRTGTFTLGNSPIKGYVDHLALLDRSIGELRRRMEQAGVWDSTTVLFTSDHENRQAKSFDGRYDYRIPYLLKLAYQKQGLPFEARFNAVVTGDLLLAVLQGDVATSADAASWLTSHPQEITRRAETEQRRTRDDGSTAERPR